MNKDLALLLANDMLWTTIVISAPILGVSMLVGLLISLFQVVTQIQEMSLTFVPKLFAVAFTLIILGPWMLTRLLDYASSLIANAPRFL